MFQQDLLTWYQHNKRELPFRKNRNAYQIWISEIMAQQTRIEAMLPYFERFIEELPDMKSLAEVSDEKLNKLWQGLGYYSRARNLKKCAQVCMEQYDGKLPPTKEQLKKLPGIGPYTAGAIASIAYGQRVSCVDGNVIRVFSRIYDCHEDMARSKGRKYIEKKVDESLPEAAYIHDYNQALMELGALICIPSGPRCDRCPIRAYCKGYANQTCDQLPVLIKKKNRRIEKKTIYIWTDGTRIRLVKRSEKGLLYQLYGFDEQQPEHSIRRVELTPYTHIFSHVEWHMKAFLVYTDQADENFHTLSDIQKKYAVPSAFQPFLTEAETLIQGKENRPNWT